MLLMPLVGFMLSRYDARKMMMGGLVVLSFSLFHMTNFDLGSGFSDRGVRPNDPDRGLGVSVRADQYRGVCLPAQREK